MVDLETLGTNDAAPIISIGAVLFDPQGDDTFTKLHAQSFLRTVDIEDAIKVCGPASGSTIKWWFGKSDAAIKRLLGDVVYLSDALKDLWEYTHARTSRQPAWLTSMPLPTRIWAKDPDFDCKILQHACAQLKIKYPFEYHIQRSVRTAQDLAFPNGELPTFTADGGEAAVHHDARDDAIMQALMIQACYKSLGLARSGIEFHRD